MATTIQSRILDLLASGPEQRAIAHYDKKGVFVWQSREEFIGQALRLSRQMADFGLKPGQVCLLVLPSEAFASAAVMGTLLTGAIPLLVAPPLLQVKEAHSSLKEIVRHIIDVTDPGLVVGTDQLSGIEEAVNGHPGARFVFEHEHFADQVVSPAEPHIPDLSEVAAMQLTSGTTGFPRVCVWRQPNVLAALDGMAAAMDLQSEDVCLNWTPLYHDMGLINNFLLCMTRGIPLVMMKPHDFVRKPALWFRALHDTAASVTWSPNFGFAISAQRVRDSEIEGVRLDRVRSFWNAAERIHYQTMTDFFTRFEPFGLQRQALKTNFGCAENVGGATFSDPHGEFLFEHLDRERLQSERVAISVDPAANGRVTTAVVGCGKPYPGMTIRIIGENGEFLPDGHIGELALDTPSRMEGYLKDSEGTAQALRGDLLVTGDIGYTRAGEFFWMGRSREKIAVHGKKLDPSDFEPILLTVPGLRHGSFAVFGVDDEDQGTQRIVLIAEVRAPDSPDLEQISGQLRDQTLKRLGVNLSEVLLVPPNTLTKTSSGKRRHRYFRELYELGELQALHP